MFSFCVIFFIVLDYDEMNCTIVLEFFYNVFQNVDSSYMQ